VKADHGSGLGLCICKNMIQLMGGNIGVTSSKGEGSTFYFILPVVTGRDELMGDDDDEEEEEKDGDQQLQNNNNNNNNGDKNIAETFSEIRARKSKAGYISKENRISGTSVIEDVVSNQKKGVAKTSSFSEKFKSSDGNNNLITVTTKSPPSNISPSTLFSNQRSATLSPNSSIAANSSGTPSSSISSLYNAHSLSNEESNSSTGVPDGSVMKTVVVGNTTTTTTTTTKTTTTTQPPRRSSFTTHAAAISMKKDESTITSGGVSSASGGEATSTAVAANLQVKKCMLVVDDVKLNRRLMKRCVEQLGFICDEAEDGVQAVDMCLHKSYVLVLMDNMMPNMTGVEATAEIREKQGNSNLIIFGLTGNALSEDMEEFKNAGCNEVLIKPLNFDYFLSLLRKYEICDEDTKPYGKSGGAGGAGAGSSPSKTKDAKKAPIDLVVPAKDATTTAGVSSNSTTTSGAAAEKDPMEQHAVSPKPRMLRRHDSNSSNTQASGGGGGSFKSQGSTSEGPVVSEKPILTRRVSSKASFMEKAEDVVSPTCLVVDDMKSNRRKMRRCMENLGFKCEEAEDGVVAVAHCENTMFSLVLMDNTMPNMTGAEATSVIREQAAGKNMVIFGVSANEAQEREEFQKSGLNEILEKPLHVPTFLEKLKKHGLFVPEGIETDDDSSSTCSSSNKGNTINSAASNASSGRGDRNSDGGVRRCLIVDDVALNRRMMRRCLEQLGFECDEAEDGALAVALCQSRQYELVLMDNMMPNMSGAEATASMRASGDAKYIFGITAHTKTEDLDNFQSAGCDEMLTKPLNFKWFQLLLDQYGLNNDKSKKNDALDNEQDLNDLEIIDDVDEDNRSNSGSSEKSGSSSSSSTKPVDRTLVRALSLKQAEEVATTGTHASEF
jgi:CheY-like chemotaxis protein